MEKRQPEPLEPQPVGPEGVPVDAPGNTAPAISPHAVSRTHRAEDDGQAREHSPEFSDAANIASDDRVGGERWIPGVNAPSPDPAKPQTN